MDSVFEQIGTPRAWKRALASAAAAYVGWKAVDGRYNLSFDAVHVSKLWHFKKAMDFLKTPGAGIPKLWYQTLKGLPSLDKPMFISADTGRHLTFAQVEELSNRIAHWALSQGLEAGDAVALIMVNCLEYMPVWLGLAKVRIVPSLINTLTKGKPLVHAINVAGSKAVIFDAEHATVVAEVADELRSGGTHRFVDFGHLDEALALQPAAPVDEKRWMPALASDSFCYVYTSGTTGLPKACKISHARMILPFTVFMTYYGVGPDDIIHGSGMPMFHTAANLGVGAAMQLGCTYIIRTKFSASQHWDDCINHGATVMQYIGELCRYLLAAPARPEDTEHKVRIAIGNGLRPEIWNDFQRRFGIPEIGEVYGSTEGNTGLMNHCRNFRGQGAVGRAGSLGRRLAPNSIVEFDVENEVPIRNASGFCVECGTNEAGELIAPLRTLRIHGGAVDDFQGYTNKGDTDKKILRDVFRKGDAYFRTGDLMRRDGQGYYYFVDRIGDTFRWKGENVSTMEVSEIVSAFPSVVDASVYGVQVPGNDGQAGMAALTLEPGSRLDPANFATYVRANLPQNAVPVFIRFLPDQMDVTSTFKHKKVEYRSEGCDPAKIKDSMWWFSTARGTYEPYGPEQYAQITGSRARL